MNRNIQRGLVATILIIGLAGRNTASAVDIFAPGDPVWGIQVIGGSVNVGTNGVAATVNNWPFAEEPQHAIDGVGQKYLNFAETMTGFIVTPSAGLSSATSITLWPANDAEERDPSSYEIWGTNSVIAGGGPFSLADFTLISNGNISLPSARNPSDSAQLSANSLTVIFANTAFYSSYLIVFPTVKNGAVANSMQIAEVQLGGVFDLCPGDPDKIDPGTCGCGTPETDSDADAVPDCIDACDGDDATSDTDNDGVCDDIDGCPGDSNKVDPGDCGCGMPETDSDGDAVPDCIDACDGNDATSDTDGDGVCDDFDGCPNDPDKVDPGACDCGTPDTDADGNGTADCIEVDDPGTQPEDSACCAPGVFPTVGFFTPIVLIGWKRRRINRRAATKNVAAS